MAIICLYILSKYPQGLEQNKPTYSNYAYQDKKHCCLNFKTRIGLHRLTVFIAKVENVHVVI